MGRLAMRSHLRFKLADIRKRRPVRLLAVFALSASIPTLLYLAFMRRPVRPFNYPLISVCSPPNCNARITLANFLAAHPAREKEIFCGSTACMDLFEGSARLQGTIITRVKLWDLAQDTPLSVFINRHKELKLNMGAEFANAVHMLSVLLAIWHRGGHYVNAGAPRHFYADPHSLDGLKPEESQKWVHKAGLLTSAFLPPSSPLLHTTMQLIARSIEKNGHVPADIDAVVRAAALGPNADISFLHAMPPVLASGQHYAILGYDHSTAITRKSNTGDEVQALTGLQFLPYNDVILDRNTWKVAPKSARCTFNATTQANVNERRLLVRGDGCTIETGNGTVTAFLNAWYGRRRQYWPPPAAIDPLLLAMYIGPMMQGHVSSKAGTHYLQQRGPIGARDTATLDFFTRSGVSAYMSACATLLFRRSYASRGASYYSVDVEERALRQIVPAEIQQNLTILTHYHPHESRFDRVSRYERAAEMLSKYERARLVITSRIHVALPCVALGVPVIFVHSRRLPGGGGNRTAGLTDLFHSAQAENGTFEPLRGFDWVNPAPNPRADLVTKYRARLWHRIRSRVALRDTAVTLGIVPYAGPIRPVTTPATSLFLVDPISASRAQRAVEGVLAAHPYATISVLSNTLSKDTLSALSDVGYAVTVRRYSARAFLSALSAYDHATFGARVSKYSRKVNRNWSKKKRLSSDSALGRLATLYFRGGVYINADVVLLRGISGLRDAIAVIGTGAASRVVFMSFRPYAPFIKRALIRLLDGGVSSGVDALLAELADDARSRNCERGRRAGERCEAERLNFAAFFPLAWKKGAACLTGAGAGVKDARVLLSETAYGAVIEDMDKVPANGKSVGGACEDIVKDRCIICGD